MGITLFDLFYWPLCSTLRYQICGYQPGWEIGLQGLDLVSYSASSSVQSRTNFDIYFQSYYDKLNIFSFASFLSVKPISDSYSFTDLTLARVYGRPEAQNLPVFWPPHHLFWAGDMILPQTGYIFTAFFIRKSVWTIHNERCRL